MIYLIYLVFILTGVYACAIALLIAMHVKWWLDDYLLRWE